MVLPSATGRTLEGNAVVATLVAWNMATFTDAELEFLSTQRLSRLATASAKGRPDVSPVGFWVEGETIVSGGLDITKTVRYRHLLENPQATIVIDDLASVDPWKPRGLKVRGSVTLEGEGAKTRIRIQPTVVWSWGINADGAPKRFVGIEKGASD
jgi:pyridoxamine 5'-phosphate oxidase family protein